MKHRFFGLGLVVLLAVGLLATGCNTGGGDSSDAPATNIRSSTLSLGGTSVGASVGAASAGGSVQGSSLSAGDRIFFRSSDIEFWQIEAVADIAGIVSAKHAEGAVDYSQNHSLEYELGDAVESIVFTPSQDVVVGIDRADLNPNWADNVAAFVGAGKTKVNAIRLDIGSGMVTFEIDGVEQDVYTADWSHNSGINGNSIFFVDRAFLSRPILITRVLEEQIARDGEPASSLGLGLTEAECTLVETIHRSGSIYDTDTPIDLNGALIVPMDPVDLTGFDPATETLDIVITWDLADVVHLSEGAYVMDDRVGHTCFDFDVSVERNAK